VARAHLIYFDLYTGYYPGFHHGLAYLIGALRDAGHEVSLAHLTTDQDLAAAGTGLPSEPIDVIGLSFGTNQKKYLRRFLAAARLGDTLTVAGGVHCTLNGAAVLDEFPQIDGVCVGEGEVPFTELCRRLDRGPEIYSTQSFIFRRDSQVVANPLAPLQPIEALPLPDYSLFDHQRIVAENGNSFLMQLGRGCPYDCSYCSNHAIRRSYTGLGKYVRFPPIPRAMEIIRQNLSLCPATERIGFSDDTFTLNRRWVIQFAERYRQEIGLPFICNARVETIDDEIAQSLKAAGCTSLEFGVESGNEWLRTQVLRRKHSNRAIEEAFATAHRHGLKTFSYNMVGLPFETKDMATATRRLNEALRPHYGRCFYFFPYPGTRLHQLCVEHDLLLDDLEWASGYLDGPSLKETHMTHVEVKRQLELLQIFFYGRLVLAKLPVPAAAEKLVHRLAALAKKPIVGMWDPKADSPLQKAVLARLRRVAKRHLR
jgi:radical SAM superfamily enzyme YgiQ (UPF0313 family)